MCEKEIINELVSSGINIAKEQSGKIFSYLKEPQINAEKHLISALQNEGTIKPDDIEIAAMHLLVRKWVKRIKNSNAVIDKANKHFEDLLHNVEYEEKIHKPDEDWLEYFFDLVSKVSNESIQDIWSFLQFYRRAIKFGQLILPFIIFHRVTKSFYLLLYFVMPFFEVKNFLIFLLTILSRFKVRHILIWGKMY